MSCTFYVAPNGNDSWGGESPSPDSSGRNGPFATLERAARAVREHGVEEGPVRVEIRGGFYELDDAFELTGLDSGLPAPTEGWNIFSGPSRTVTFAAFEGETVVLSGGRRLSGFSVDTLMGEPVWRLELPEVASGSWYFTQLWVNGRRASRPRLPRTGRFTIEEPLGTVVYEGDVHQRLFTGQDQFRYRAGDLDAWRNIEDIEFVALHYWIESRINFTRIDTEDRIARLARTSRMRLTDDFEKAGAPYYVENVFEAFSEPGTWYLDRPSGTLFYRPLEGESIDDAQIVAPRLPLILDLKGTAQAPIHHLRFEGLTFSHTEWVPGAEALTATPQAACHVGGAVHVERGAAITFSRCDFLHLGSYGIEIAGASSDIDIERCTISDLGGGGVKVWHSFESGDAIIGAGPDWNYTEGCRRVRITDSIISDGGYRFHQAAGVLIGMCSGVQVLHNEIHDFDYTGVSVGWTWGYDEGYAYGNLIEYNHIYNIGRHMLSDMGAIYTLGVQPGTRITHNVIHDVWSRGYGGFGIYNDEGSSYILMENNLVYRTKSNGYNQHYGKENIVRNNIFAFGGEAQFSRGRGEDHTSFAFTNNIMYFDSDGIVLAGDWRKLNAVVDSNCYYNVSGKPLLFAGDDFETWRARGADANSIVEDPGFADPRSGDFSLSEDTPARKIGFRPFDLSNVGPRPETE